MKIGIFTELYPPHIGGQEIRYAELAAALLDLGHSVDVYCIRHTAEVPTHEVLSGVSVFRHPLAPSYKKPLFSGLRRAVLPLIQYSLWVRRMARQDNYDLMIFNQWPLGHIVLASNASRQKIILDWCEVRSGLFYRILMKWLPRLCGRNIAVSIGVAKRVAAASGRTLQYIPSGVWPSKYQCPDAANRSGILYLGRVTEHKNLPLLLDAFELLREAGYRGDLVIAGAGPALAALIERSKSSRFFPSIQFRGFIDDETKISLLANSEVFVIPSRREGFPRVVAEGMASGLPTVTVNFPDNGTKEVVNDYQIGLVADPTARELAEKILDVLENWQVYSDNCRKNVSALDWEVLVRRLLDPLEEGRQFEGIGAEHPDSILP